MREFREEEFRQLKAESTKNISVFGPTLAAQFIKAGLVDEYALYYVPVVLGAGNSVFKDLEGRLDLDLIEEGRFPLGMVCGTHRARREIDHEQGSPDILDIAGWVCCRP